LVFQYPPTDNCKQINLYKDYVSIHIVVETLGCKSMQITELMNSTSIAEFGANFQCKTTLVVIQFKTDITIGAFPLLKTTVNAVRMYLENKHLDDDGQVYGEQVDSLMEGINSICAKISKLDKQDSLYDKKLDAITTKESKEVLKEFKESNKAIEF
jgi:hypothetical protein